MQAMIAGDTSTREPLLLGKKLHQRQTLQNPMCTNCDPRTLDSLCSGSSNSSLCLSPTISTPSAKLHSQFAQGPNAIITCQILPSAPWIQTITSLCWPYLRHSLVFCRTKTLHRFGYEVDYTVNYIHEEESSEHSVVLLFGSWMKQCF